MRRHGSKERVLVGIRPRRKHPLEALESRHKKLPPGGYAMLANVRCLEGETARIGPDVVIRVAAREETKELRHLLRYWGPRRGVVPQEYTIEFKTTEPGVSHITSTPLAQHDVRYVIADVAGSNHALHTLQQASCLTAKPFELGINVFQGHGWGGGISGGSDPGLARASDEFQSRPGYLLELGADDLDDLRGVYARLRERTWVDELVLTIGQFIQLRRIPRSMPLRVLGCFTLMESLLAHKPDPTDQHQSLTRQIYQKLALLDGRFFKRRFVYANGIKHETFWKRMYAYRSAIAHGNLGEANTPPAPLPDRDAILTLLESTISQVLRCTLDEPVLMRGLRDC